MKAIAAILLLPLLAFAQAVPSATSGPPQESTGFTIRIGVDLVQVDAVVTDSADHPITGLHADDFDILQDGQLQKITNFSFVKVADVQPVQEAKDTTPGSPASPRVLKPDQVRRVLAFVVDDLGLSFESVAHVRAALKRFVDEQMQPGDLVAILRTGAGIGALQQFTSDKRLLYAAIDRVKFNPLGRVGISSFDPFAPGPPGPSLARRFREGQSQYTGNRPLQDIYTIGTLGALSYVIEGLHELPGRKCVIVFSESMRMSNEPLVIDGLRRLTDAAARSSTIIYTLDPRGLSILGLGANDATSDMSGEQLISAETRRVQDYRNSQEGLSYLAGQTGGLFLHDSNDLPDQMRQVLTDSSGYYLIGYRPAAGTFDPVTGLRKFHSLKVRVKRPGLQVRGREGFFGVADRERRSIPADRESQMAHALASPFSSGDIHLRLTTLFFNSEKGSYIRSLLHADARDIPFNQQPDGSYQASVDILAGLFGDNGQIVASGDHSRIFRVAARDYDDVLRNGFILTDQLFLKKPGAFQMRLVLRDAATKKLGSASQFLEIPDVKNRHLALSGILLKEASADVSLSTPAAPAPSLDPKGNAAVRAFKPGAKITYAYEVLNAISDPNRPPQVSSQVRLFHDGKQFFEGELTPVDFSSQKDMLHPMAGGLIQLGPQFAPGDYVLQVVVTDNRIKKSRYRSAAQWMDFEVE